MGAYSRLGAYSNKYGSLPVSARGLITGGSARKGYLFQASGI